MSQYQIIYSSRPFGFDSALLSGILLDARRCNTRDRISGALICRNDLYMQFLEGPMAAVQAAYERIMRDDRHLEVTMRATRTAPERLFGAWAMLHDPSTSWLWTPAEIAAGVLDHVAAADLWHLFENIAKGDLPEDRL